MTTKLDITDVALVSARELALPMRMFLRIAGLSGLGQAVEADVRAVIEDRFWRAYSGSQARGTAVLLRFWSLIDVFAARRLATLIAERGDALIGPALFAGATMRLNINWGFNPQKLVNTVRCETALVVAHAHVLSRGAVPRLK